MFLPTHLPEICLSFQLSRVNPIGTISTQRVERKLRHLIPRKKTYRQMVVLHGNNFCFCLFIDYNLFILVLCNLYVYFEKGGFQIHCLEKQERCMQKCCIQTSAYHHQFSSFLHHPRVPSDTIKSCCTLWTSRKGRRYQRNSSI